MDHQGTGNPATDVSTETASSGPSVHPTYPERGGIDVFDSLLVRQPIANGQTEAVRKLLTDCAGDNADGDVHTLLPVDSVTLVTEG